MKILNVFKFKKLSNLLFGLFDIAIVLIGFYLAFLIKFNFDIPERNITPFIEALPFLAAIAFIYFDVYEVYSLKKKDFLDMFFSISIALFLLLLTSMAIIFLFRGFAFPRSIFFISFFIQLVILSVWKYCIIYIYRKIYGVKQVMIFGGEKQAKYIITKLFEESSRCYEIKYVFSHSLSHEVIYYIKDVDIVVISDDIISEEKSHIIELCQEFDKEVFVIPDIYNMQIFNSDLTRFDDMLAFRVKKIQLSSEQFIIKRALDLIVSFILFVFFLPCMITIILLMKIDDPKGTIIFSQERLTINHRKFNLYKFRTMIEDAEKMTGPVLAGEDDDRITKLGKILRLTRMDELPQLINVLKGDMSIVGPRPERECFVEQYIKESASYSYRMNVKAGITGLAQILGKYATTYEDKAKFDLLYIKNYSILLDIKIILQTIKVMFTGSKSKGVNYNNDFDEISKKFNLKTFSEISVTKVDL